MTMAQNQTSSRWTRSGVMAAIVLLLLGAPVGAQLGTVAPYPNPPYLDASGNPCALCTINSYVTGASSTPLDTFTTAALNVANANPIVLDAAGQASVYLTPGLTYRFVLKTAAGATLWTRDGIAGPNGVAADRLRVSAHSATIATGAFTATYSQYAVDTEGAAASDDLDTITAGTGVGAGTLLLVTPANVSHVVTAKDSTGNLKLGGGDYALDSAKKSLTLYYDGSNWVEVARAGAGSRVSAGTVSAPGLGVGDTDVGLYSSGTNALDFTTNGVKALGIDATQFIDSPTQPRAVAYHNATQSIADTTLTTVTLNSEDVDVGTLHDLVTNNSRITVPTGGDGFYLVRAHIPYAANATGYRYAAILKNGSVIEQCIYPGSDAADITSVECTYLGTLAAADYIEMQAKQHSGGALNVGSASRNAAVSLSVVKLW